MFLVDFIKEGISRLEKLYPTAEARSIIMILCESFLGTKNYTHIVEPEYKINKNKIQILEDALVRLEKGEPIQYVTGNAEFCGFNFKVTPDVLIPRPETELLCREAIKIGLRIYRMRQAYGKKAEPLRVLDLCTGSGCIAWVLALSIPGAKVIGVDISEAALKVAQEQVFFSKLKMLGAESPTFIKADILDCEQEFNYSEFDLILSNPPYIMDSEKQQMRKNVLDYEPENALFVRNEDPLIFHKAIAKWSQRFLSYEGVGMTEINSALGNEVQTLMKDFGFSDVEIIKDFYDKRRFVKYKK